ncbi:ABC transporter permease [Romboutsia sp. 1001713B170207_170306_H8]|uniref:ABC transporter permease n=1 Tax=Romboutsia sp. 1001713B170207_170306_H8 TaxID=2787112 RepID=UPI0008227FC5|nr:FtsX-like permease family protein [Romboutsia sp. 1001713B170207_170306_H8]SCG94994.1 macrolide transporter ATP-binding /permease protein [uncultured Clostridium sp.]
MNLYTSLTIRYLKENKKRTIVTIIGIILSTALICGIGNIFESFMDYQIRETISNDGAFHATFYDIKKDDIDTITKSAGISKSALSDNLGYSKIKNNDNSLIRVKSYDNESFEGYQINLKEGKLPINENEIVLSESAYSLVNKNIGDTIKLQIGKRESKDGDNVSGYYSPEQGEKLVELESKNFKIVGIIERPGFEYNGNGVVTAITHLDINKLPKNKDINVSICANKPSEIYDIASKISKNLGFKEDIVNEENVYESDSLYYSSDKGVFYENLSFNEHLLRIQGASAYTHINNTIYMIMSIVTILVVVCTIATVYNAFSISISERKKQFGVLNSIGATKYQVMKLVFIEALIVSIIAIPIGIICGSLAIDLVFKCIQSLFKNSFIAQMNLRVVYKPYIIIGSSIIVMITIFVSAILPAMSAAKTSPLEAIKNSSNLKLGKVKDSKIIKLLFKAEGVLAYKNLRRNKKKFRITLFSLIISVVIFISFSGFMELFVRSNEIHTGQMNYDMNLYKNGEVEDNNLINDLRNINGIENFSINNYYAVGTYIKESNIDEIYKDLVSKYFEFEEKNNEFIYDFLNNHIMFPGDYAIGKLNLTSGSIDKERAINENGIILRNKSYYEEPGKKGDVSLTNYKVGDTIDIYEVSYDENTGEEIKTPIKLKVLATTEDLLPGNLSSTHMGIDFITYDEVGEKLGFDIDKSMVYISTNKNEESRDLIKALAENNGYNVNDELEYAKEMEESAMAIKVFVYGFVVVISLVSITNIVNTISTNINLRKRELAIIKSIGVTPRGFNKMIYLEGLLYGVLALLYGVPIGLGIDILMNKTLGDVIDVGMILPWGAVGICFVGIFVITFIASYIPMSKINKENIIENIRQESI